jgi:hypothetical protein
VGELESRADIAGGEYARVRSAQPGIDFDSSGRIAYSGCFQVESFHIGCAANRDQDGIATEFGCRILNGSGERFFMAIFGGALNLRCANNPHAIVFHLLAHNRRGIAIFLGQDLRAVG